MSTAAQFSIDHYEHMVEVGAFTGRFEKRVELIRGEIVQMTPINIAHANCVTVVTEWSIQVAPLDQFMIRCQNPIRIPSSNSEPEPDIVWVKRRKYLRHPEPSDIVLVIEVADRSLQFDRTEKLEVYARAGIAEYWVVNLVDEQVEVHRSPVGHGYKEKLIHRGDAAVSPMALPSASLHLSRLFDK
jgi:Uma2 family endonuclease